MKKITLTFGLIAGGILVTAIILPLSVSGKTDFGKSEIVGYTALVLAFTLVFFGIRSYRENVGGGAITFGKAFKVGILITLVACAVYVISWEIVYFNFIPDFADRYTAYSIEKLRKSGASDAKILSETKKAEDFKRLYANPLINSGMTFMEAFPAGLIVTLVSAGILRRRAGVPPAVSGRLA